MSATPGTIITINNVSYDTNQLPPQAQPLVQLLLDTQSELQRLEHRKAITQLAQQQLLVQLTPLLPPQQPQPTGPVILGQASATIPTTPVEKPAEEPAPFPENIPPEIRNS